VGGPAGGVRQPSAVQPGDAVEDAAEAGAARARRQVRVLAGAHLHQHRRERVRPARSRGLSPVPGLRPLRVPQQPALRRVRQVHIQGVCCVSCVCRVSCADCAGVASQDGRKWSHCDACGLCVPPGRVHCDTCGRCDLPQHLHASAVRHPRSCAIARVVLNGALVCRACRVVSHSFVSCVSCVVRVVSGAGGRALGWVLHVRCDRPQEAGVPHHRVGQEEEEEDQATEDYAQQRGPRWRSSRGPQWRRGPHRESELK